MIPLSVLDLSPIVQGGSAAVALSNSLDLARKVERLGFHRYWLPEHHNMPGIASAATSVVIAHIAGATASIRVGAGGIMLPNHSPLVIAEQFGTLATLFPGRIDLGIGRSPGTDPQTAKALMRSRHTEKESFQRDVMELMHYFNEPHPDQSIFAIPGVGTRVPIWILGSSLYGAQLAAQLGLRYAFGSHFAPAQLDVAVMLYRESFRASPYQDRPYVMLSLNVIAADSDREATRLFTSLQQAFTSVNALSGRLAPPVNNIEGVLPPDLVEGMNKTLTHSIVGGPDKVAHELNSFIELYKPDEIMVTSQIYEHAARVHSFEILAKATALTVQDR